MFHRYTERAQRVVIRAQDHARELGLDQAGTEHLLLGILSESPSLAVSVLDSLGVDLGAIRAEILKNVGRGEGVAGEVGFTHRAQKVMRDLAPAESAALGHTYVGSEHLLLGLLREGEGMAAVVLDRFGINQERVRTAVRRLLSGQTPAGETNGAAAPGPVSDIERVMRILQRAQHEAWRLGGKEVGLEHLLIAILADPEAADLSDMLRVRGVTLEWLRDQFQQG